MRYLFLLFPIGLLFQCTAQEKALINNTATMSNKEMSSNIKEVLPYHQIPEYPSTYDAGNIAGRTVDGLGYRYYWATKDLRPEDLAYQPSPEASSLDKTMDHLFGLSQLIKNATLGKANVRLSNFPTLSHEERRAATLRNIKEASDTLKGKSPKELENMTIVFKRGASSSEFPFWNLLNGPVADAIYHTGQVVSFRRTSGNPIPAGVNVFMGKTRE